MSPAEQEHSACLFGESWSQGREPRSQADRAGKHQAALWEVLTPDTTSPSTTMRAHMEHQRSTVHPDEGQGRPDQQLTAHNAAVMCAALPCYCGPWDPCWRSGQPDRAQTDPCMRCAGSDNDIRPKSSRLAQNPMHTPHEGQGALMTVVHLRHAARPGSPASLALLARMMPA